MFNFINFSANKGLFTNLLFALILCGMFFFLSYSQSKKKKQEDAMRKNLKIGDEITTVGGIVGKIISFREENDSAVIESGTERLRIRRWAISVVNNIDGGIK